MVRGCAVLVGLAIGLTGCMDSKSAAGKNRGQIGGDDSLESEAYATVGMKTSLANLGPVAVSGVGLVYGLQPGTGSNAPPGSWRQMLEANLKKNNFTHVKSLLDDENKTTSLVLVSALIPPGARKGEKIDVQISLPDESKTTSLKGGILVPCDLVDYDTTANIHSVVKDGKPGLPGGNLLLGNVWLKAAGPIAAGVLVQAGKDSTEPKTASDLEPPSLRVGRIWTGGRIVRPRPYYFMMNPDDQSMRMAANVAERLNSTFFGNGDPNQRIAVAKTRELVVVSVPYAYRNNHLRFLQVARQVPINPVGPESEYRRKLEEKLHDPSRAIVAAIKLEALGGNTRQPLRVALNNTSSAWVRFAAAESLAYQGYSDGAAELARLAETHPALRAYCLKALASSDDASFTDRLVELMGASDPVLRYGAFIALRLAGDGNPLVNGHRLNQSLWLHRVAAGTPGLIHLSSDRRSEIVIFGDGVKFTGPFTLPVGADITVSASAGDNVVKVTKIVSVNGELTPKEVTCKSADVEEVLTVLAKFGGGYAEAVELLRRADSARRLTSDLVVDAIPRQMSIQDLAAFARTDPGLVKADREVARVGTIRTDLEKTGVDLTDPDTEPKVEPPPVRQPLSRQPGRIFGPKLAPETTPVEPLTPVEAEEPTAPPEPAPVNTELSRNPGRLFQRK